jgi:hypothetical protein
VIARERQAVIPHLAKQQGWRLGGREAMMRWRKEVPVCVAGSPFSCLGFLLSPLLRSRRRAVTPARNGATVAAHTSRGLQAESNDTRDSRRAEASRQDQAQQSGEGRVHERGRASPRMAGSHAVDHLKPPARGGADAPSSMLWQTTAEAKAQDKVERVGCS